FSSRRRHTRCLSDWSSDVCSSDLGLATSILIRRRFGLASGSYDILLGLTNTILFYSGLGIPTSLMKTLPERELGGGRRGVVRFQIGRASCRERVWGWGGGGA